MKISTLDRVGGALIRNENKRELVSTKCYILDSFKERVVDLYQSREECQIDKPQVSLRFF